MISEKSSHNVFGFSFRKALKGKVIYTIFSAIVLLMDFGQIFSSASEARQAAETGAANAANSFKNTTLFVIGNGNYYTGVVTVLLIIAAAVLALIMFSYMINKSSTNVYFSLGISRTGLFVSRYLAGALLIASGVIIPFLIIAIANIIFLQSSVALWLFTAHIVLKYTTVLLYSFTMMALVMTQFGSMSESIVIGSVCIASPILLNNALSTFMGSLPYGSPYDFNTIFGTDTALYAANGDTIDTTFSLFHASRYFLPADDMMYELGKGEKYINPSFGWPLFFLTIVIVLAIAATVSYSHRKAEKAGFMGTGPAVEGYCVVVVGAQLAALVTDMLSTYSVTITRLQLFTVLAGVVIMAVGYTVVDMICVRSLKTFGKRLWHLGAEVGVFLAAMLVFCVVLSGKYSSVPEKSEIKSAAVSMYVDEKSSYQYMNNEYNQGKFESICKDRGYARTMVENLNKDSEIDAVLSLNSLFISNKKLEASQSPVCITYTLKNGKTVTREYKTLTDETNSEISKFCSSDGFKEAYINALPTLSVKPEQRRVLIASRNFSSFKTVSNSEKIAEGLFEAIKADIKDGTMPLDSEYYAPILGYVEFQTVNPDDASLKAAQEDAKGDVTGEHIFTGSCFFTINEKMKNTVDYINSNGLSDYFAVTAEPISITYGKPEANSETSYDNYTGILTGRFFGEGDQSNAEIWYDENGKQVTYNTDADLDMPEGSVVVTDAAEISRTESGFRLRTPDSGNVYYAKLKFADGTFAYGFIPSGLISD